MYKKNIKRTLDVLMSLLILAFFWPLMFLIAIAIKLDSRGPVFFRQRRYNGVHDTFMVYKFRTMKVNARKRMQSAHCKQQDMITRTGKVLRELHIDELPNVFNILKGDMSFVGVRPQQQSEQKAMLASEKDWGKRFEGSVGAVSLERLINIHPPIFKHIIRRLKNGKYLLKCYKRVDFDLYYVNNESFHNDFIIAGYLGKIVISKLFRIIFERDFREYEQCDQRWKNRKLY